MLYRPLGRTGLSVSSLSFGAWAIGGAWGPTDDADSLAALHRAIDLGVNFIDTADVYGDGRSERLIAQLRKDRPRDTIHVATKAGRRLNPHSAPGYNRENLTAFVDRSLKNLNTDSIDLLQLHCPPTAVYYSPEVFQILDDLTRAGKLRHYGVSVEKVEEALKAIEYPNVKTVQIIFNIFRQRPACPLGFPNEHAVVSERSESNPSFLDLAKLRNIGILARVPLCSGLLTGKMSKSTTFPADDHRNFNRLGQHFDRGETFSGIDYDTALSAVDQLRSTLRSFSEAGSPGMSMTQFALRWILSFDAVTCAIPGAKTPAQSDENFSCSDLPPLPPETMQKVRAVYDSMIAPQVHHRW